ncbi:MAG TPA: glycosyltransferase [Pseudonocardiaceae bacterium]|jgi:glycosyltransferase involved in cell wall biosynthesis
MPDPGGTIAVTAVPLGRLSSARVVAESYRRHHPEHEFVIFVTDRETPAVDLDCRVVGYGWLGAAEYPQLASAAAADQLVDVVLPLVVRRLLDEAELVVALGPQVLVLGAFGELPGDISLVPAVLSPVPDDGLEPAEVGGFDSGFVAVRREGAEFVDFWADRVRRDLFAAPEPSLAGSGVARDWRGDAVALFDVAVLRDRGFGLGYWNLHERSLVDARYVNFAGYSVDSPWVLSSACVARPRVLLSASAELRALADEYRGLLGESADSSYGFGSLADGSPVTAAMREAFRAELVEWERVAAGLVPLHQGGVVCPPDAFSVEFAEWLSAPVDGLNRLVLAVWRLRVDLMVSFPQPRHGNAVGFRDWCRRHGVGEGLPEWAIPAEPDGVRAPVDQFGVNVAGYLTAELGLGEMGRILHDTVRAAGVPAVSVVEERSLSGVTRTGVDAPETVGAPRFPLSILAVNADFTELLLSSHPEVGAERYRIGFWAWELEEFPARFDVGFGLVDEVWANSEFARDAMAKRATVPVKAFPVPVPDVGVPDRVDGPTTFLFAFDFNSTGQRKNPWGVVEAFRRAFAGRDDVRLVIKAINAHLHGAAAERLRYVVGDDSRVELLERYLSSSELSALYARCSAYVSLHRSEGFGLTVAEAMIRGIPVICTDYSATSEFVDPSVGWLIPHTMVEVGPGWPPYQADALWAEPDLDVAAAAMRAVADDPDEAWRRGAAGRELLLRTRSVSSAAAWVREQLEAAYQVWQARQAGSTGAGDMGLAKRLVRRAAGRLAGKS